MSVTATLSDQNGQPVVGAIMSVTLSATDEYLGFVAKDFQRFTTDSLGQITMPLWSNTLGVNNTHYIFVARDSMRRKLFSGTGVVPVAGPVALSSFMVLD